MACHDHIGFARVDNDEEMVALKYISNVHSNSLRVWAWKLTTVSRHTTLDGSTLMYSAWGEQGALQNTVRLFPDLPLLGRWRTDFRYLDSRCGGLANRDYVLLDKRLTGGRPVTLTRRTILKSNGQTCQECSKFRDIACFRNFDVGQ